MVLCLVGCATPPPDEADLAQLPVAVLAAETVEGLAPCGDTVPLQGDALVRLGDGSNTVVLFRDGEPYCAEDLATWLSPAPSPTGDDQVEGETEGDSSAPGDPQADQDEPGSKESVNGPRPIPWMDGDDDKKHDDK